MPSRKPPETVRYMLELLEEFPQESKRRLGLVAHSRRPDLYSSAEAARSCIRVIFGQKGEKVRKSQKLSDSPRKGAVVFSMPKTTTKEWSPYEVKAGVIAVLSDIHFPKHDEKALLRAVKHIKENWTPSVLLLNGDIADAEEFSNWAKNPRALNTNDALQSVRQGLLWLRQEFPNVKMIYKMGNHEERLEKYCWQKAPELVGLPHITWEGLLKIDNELNKIAELKDIVFVDDQRPVMLGNLPVFHGHELPKGSGSINPARSAYMRLNDSAMVGHHHQSSSFVQYNWKKEAVSCWSTGCLCYMHPSYAKINKWNHGHAVVEVSRSGAYEVHNYQHLNPNKMVVA